MTTWAKLIQDVQSEIESGVVTFREIAARYSISYDDVCTVAAEMEEYCD